MSTCDRMRLFALLAPLAALVLSACGAESGGCLRFSDCAEGLTCAYGRCVLPPPPATAADAATGDGPVSTSTSDAGGPSFPGDDAGTFPTQPFGNDASASDAATE